MPKIGVTDFVSEILRAGNNPAFWKLVHAIRHGLQEFIVKNSKEESAEAKDLSDLTFQKAFETAVQINLGLKITEFNGACCKETSNFKSIDFLSIFSFGKRTTSNGKLSTKKKEKNRFHRTSKIVKSRQSYSNAHLPYYCSFYYSACTLRVNLGFRKKKKH